MMMKIPEIESLQIRHLIVDVWSYIHATEIQTKYIKVKFDNFMETLDRNEMQNITSLNMKKII